MKKRLALLLLLLPAVLRAQNTNQFGPPTGYCSGGPATVTDVSATPSQQYVCAGSDGHTWTKVGGAGGSGPTPIAGALADYNFLQGTGTVLTDASGNGNNGTLGAGSNAPTWVTNGLHFAQTQNVALPAALNTARSFTLAFYAQGPALSNATNATVYLDALLTSSLGNVGLNMVLSDGQGSNPAMTPLTLVGSFNTQSSIPISGFNVLTYTLGTGGGDTDHIYLNGNEVNYLTLQASAGYQTSGFLYLGSSNISYFVGTGFVGTYYRAVVEAREDTAAQAQAVYQSVIADMNSRAVATTPQGIATSSPVLIASGDSITFGFGLPNPTAQAWPVLLSLTNQPAYAIINAGIPNISARSLAGAEPNRMPYCGAAQTVAILFAGTNDVDSFGISPAAAMGSIASWVKKEKAAGCLAFVGTMLSRQSTGGDVNKNALDALILTSAKAAGADGVIDFAANPLLGADGASTNATYFQGDNIHPTVAGHTLLAAAASNTLNYYFGTTLASPAVVTASATLPSGDRAVSVGTLTAAIALVMPDCTGPSGESYTISNPQSAFAVTIAGGTSQPINGLAGAITIAANSTVTLRDVANPKSVSGCHWAM